MSPLLQKLRRGYRVHSATKFICGHWDAMAGVCCVDDEALFKRLYFVQNAEEYWTSSF